MTTHTAFHLMTLTLEVDLIFENLNFAYDSSTSSARGLIFHMNIPCDKTLPWGTNIVLLVNLRFKFDLFIENLTLPITFEQCARALIFQMSISCDTTLACGTNICYPMPETWSLKFNRFT